MTIKLEKYRQNQSITDIIEISGDNGIMNLEITDLKHIKEL